MNSLVALLVVALVGSAIAAPSGHLIGHGVPIATSALVAGPSGVISSHQSNGAIAVAAPVAYAGHAVVAAAPAVVSYTTYPGHAYGYGHDLGYGFGLGYGAHGL